MPFLSDSHFLRGVCRDLRGIPLTYCNATVFGLALVCGWNFYHTSSLLSHSWYSFLFHWSFCSELSLNKQFKNELPSANIHSSLSCFIFPSTVLIPQQRTCIQDTHTHTLHIHSLKYALHYSRICVIVHLFTALSQFLKCPDKWCNISKHVLNALINLSYTITITVVIHRKVIHSHLENKIYCSRRASFKQTSQPTTKLKERLQPI